MAQTRLARQPIIAASISANQRMTHCRRDSAGHQAGRRGRERRQRCQKRRHEGRQETRQETVQATGQDCPYRLQAGSLRPATNRTRIAAMLSVSWASAPPARSAPDGLGWKSAATIGSGRGLAAASSSANIVVARRRRGSVDRAVSAATCATASIARRTGRTASAATMSLSA